MDVQPARVHIFDVDHTLTRNSTGMIYARAGLRSGMVTHRQLATLPFYYLRYRLGRLSLGAVTREIKPLQGYSRDQLHTLAQRAWEEEGRTNMYRPALAYIEACRSAGALIVLATSTFDVILNPMREPLGVDHVVSSILEFDGQDRSTGWLTGGPCYAEAKAERVLDLLSQLAIDPASCAFYSDSYHDLPALKAVGMPVAVNPDIFLRRVARREGWPILWWNREKGIN